MLKKLKGLFLLGVIPIAQAMPEGDVYIPSYQPRSQGAYTVLDAKAYRQTVADARRKVVSLLAKLQPYRQQSWNNQVAFLANSLSDIPYMFAGAYGEGDWQPNKQTYHPGAMHIQQDPVYRFDGLNCVTFVQVVLGLLHASSLASFDSNILRIAYGTAGNPNGEIVHYFNRNNFVEVDFNPVNQRNGFLQDVTSDHPAARTVHATIMRQNWFNYKQQHLGHVRVLSDHDGTAMVARLLSYSQFLKWPNFDSEEIDMSYFPKESIALKQDDGSYLPNTRLLDNIPTPAVMEVVRDPSRWYVNGRPIRDIFGSEQIVSHLGLLYRQTFTKNQIIYQKTYCYFNQDDVKKCEVTPVRCNKAQCTELMFAQATSAFPNDFYWSKRSDGTYACTAGAPKTGTRTKCNRVVSLPLFNYITEYQFNGYWYMNHRAILGVHVEKIVN